MKFIIVSMLAGLFMFPHAEAFEGEKRETREQVVSINDAYIPSGFDSSSDAFVVINGLFPNSCYRFRDAKVEQVDANLYEVRAYAQVTEGLCLMVLVPFSKEVQLGRLAPGVHSIRFVNGDGTHWEKRLTVEN
jgi:hypothetical protein